MGRSNYARFSRRQSGTIRCAGARRAAAHPQITADQAVRLVFAWTRSNSVPVIFGQMNFFLEFDVCFYRSRNQFAVNLKSP